MITLEKVGQRVYLVGLPFAVKDRAKDDLGAKWDGERKQWWVGLAKASRAEALIAELNAAHEASDEADPETVADDARVYARVKYKARSYYVVAESRAANRCRLATIDGKVSFWAEMADCELLKTYEGRQDRGAYGRPTGRTVYTTLGSIRRFVERERRARDAGEPVCAECGISGELVQDLEDGLMKHRRCCDMAP